MPTVRPCPASRFGQKRGVPAGAVGRRPGPLRRTGGRLFGVLDAGPIVGRGVVAFAAVQPAGQARRQACDAGGEEHGDDTDHACRVRARAGESLHGRAVDAGAVERQGLLGDLERVRGLGEAVGAGGGDGGLVVVLVDGDAHAGRLVEVGGCGPVVDVVDLRRVLVLRRVEAVDGPAVHDDGRDGGLVRRAGEVGDGECGSGVGEGHAVRGEDVERVPPAHAPDL